MTNSHSCRPKATLIVASGAVIVIILALWLLIQPAKAQEDSEITRLVAVLEEDPPFINPGITTTISSYHSGTPIYSGLTIIDTDYTIRPDLAVSWEQSDDGLSYTFQLRDGVVWHDGEPFSCADVEFSIENANSQLQPYGRGVYKFLEDVECTDNLTAVIHLTEPFTPLMMGTNITASAILPKHIFDNGEEITDNPANLEPIGTGPYMFREWVRGDHITLEKNPDYYFEGQPAFDELVFRILPDPASRLQAYDAGEVDVIYHNAMPFNEAPRYENVEGSTVKWTDQRGSVFMGFFNVREGRLFADRLVRHAIAHAVDREFIKNNVNVGSALDELMLGPVPPVSPLYNEGLEDYEYGPDRAEELLDEAGYPRGDDGTRFTMELYIPSNIDGIVAMAEVMQQNLAEIGVQVNVNTLERAALVDAAYVNLEYDFLIDSYGLGPDPAIGVERLYNSNNILNPPAPYTNNSGYVNPEVDEMFAESNRAADPADRKAIYDEIQEIIWDDLPTLPMMAYLGPNLYRSSYVTGVFDLPFGNQEPYATAELVDAGTGEGATSDTSVTTATDETVPVATEEEQEGSAVGIWIGVLAVVIVFVGVFIWLRSRRTNA